MNDLSLKEQTSKQLIQLRNENRIIDNPTRYHLWADEKLIRHHCMVQHLSSKSLVGYQALELVESISKKTSRLRWGIGTYWFFTHDGLSWGRTRSEDFKLSNLQADNVDINGGFIVKTVQGDYDLKLSKAGHQADVFVFHIMSVSP